MRSGSAICFKAFGANQRDFSHDWKRSYAPSRSMRNGATASGRIRSESEVSSTTIGHPQYAHFVDVVSDVTVEAAPHCLQRISLTAPAFRPRFAMRPANSSKLNSSISSAETGIASAW